jgi:hypothetical protein
VTYTTKSYEQVLRSVRRKKELIFRNESVPDGMQTLADTMRKIPRLLY